MLRSLVGSEMCIRDSHSNALGSSDIGDAGLRVQVGFPPFALAETAARVWGGSIAISLLWYDLLTSPTTRIVDDAASHNHHILPRSDSTMSSAKRSPQGLSTGKRRNSQTMVPSRRLEFLELGCGCALPSCAMAKILLHHPVSYTHLTLPTKRIV
eukprot:TRINITY_DN12146_c0_g1_i1.p1 TRINITY_DN12146_c0_g1~~TRINITY_DN12146_c0_g1_i1.p1  ORF type:complete len:181 (+),score=38.97 TRINITY_DN12146_c0_g1_i1:80-544(+)